MGYYQVDPEGVSHVARQIGALEPVAMGAVGVLLATYDASAVVVKHSGMASAMQRYRDRYEQTNRNLPKHITKLAVNNRIGGATLSQAERDAMAQQTAMAQQAEDLVGTVGRRPGA